MVVLLLGASNSFVTLQCFTTIGKLTVGSVVVQVSLVVMG